jgi:hypothetical protein
LCLLPVFRRDDREVNVIPGDKLHNAVKDQIVIAVVAHAAGRGDKGKKRAIINGIVVIRTRRQCYYNAKYEGK